MTTPSSRLVAVVTGSRAEFGLLAPVMRAILAHPDLHLHIIVTGTHLLGPAETWRDVRSAGFEIGSTVEMQLLGQHGALADATAVGRGIQGFASIYGSITPAWVVVLGDRIEAFAAAAAASIGGFALAHMHGGDRAEGIADEAMRHAISKLAHLHLPATQASADRLKRMGESPDRIHIVGSPAIDGLDDVLPMSDADAAALGDPDAVFLMHPSGLCESDERALLRGSLHACAALYRDRPLLALMPNHDPGREAVLDELTHSAERFGWKLAEHLERSRFLALLKRLASRERGALIGNSSAGLIEAAALQLPVVNIGLRQNGRERPDNVVDAPTSDAVSDAIRSAWKLNRGTITHPYGDGSTGAKTASILASIDPETRDFRRKHCTY